ncbi:MAG: hypothetical protein OXT67_11770 [Zetaproteobacteria bacterium]|nr:hypothetical protein [Zetaproteobacteria bacterium]
MVTSGKYLFACLWVLGSVSASAESPRSAGENALFQSNFSHPLTRKFQQWEQEQDALGRRYELYERTSFAFVCPDNSFMVGVESTFEFFNQVRQTKDISVDRNFRFTCRFLVDEQQQPVLKQCKQRSAQNPWPAQIKATQKAHPRSLKAEPEAAGYGRGHFIHAFASSRWFESTYLLNPVEEHGTEAPWQSSPAQNLHLHSVDSVDWCSMHDHQGRAYEATACENAAARTVLQKPFQFMCPEGKFLRAIWSNYSWRHFDRTYLFQCCGAKLRDTSAASAR